MSVDSSLGSSNGGRPLNPVRKYAVPRYRVTLVREGRAIPATESVQNSEGASRILRPLFDGLDLAKSDGSFKVWHCSKNYEEQLKRTLGEPKYQQLCQKYERTAKPSRARLIASEIGLPVPSPFEEALLWLANKVNLKQ